VILLVSGATKTLRGLPGDAPVGHLLTPANGNNPSVVMATGRPVALDNGCGPRQDGTPGVFDEQRWVAFTNAIAAIHNKRGVAGSNVRSHVLWAACPDAVGDARETLRLWQWWHHHLRGLGLPIAFVAQDGAENLPIPWSKMRCLFLGGTTDYKESAEAKRLVVKAKQLGLLVHIGRVNSERRLRLFDDLGCDARGVPYAIDSIDGTQFSMFPDRYIPRWAERLKPSMQSVRSVRCRDIAPMELLWEDAA
jgi:hypothetical protein